jgi:hypothetical protein
VCDNDATRSSNTTAWWLKILVQQQILMLVEELEGDGDGIGYFGEHSLVWSR